mgnify:CR=1 FL=1
MVGLTWFGISGYFMNQPLNFVWQAREDADLIRDFFWMGDLVRDSWHFPEPTILFRDMVRDFGHFPEPATLLCQAGSRGCLLGPGFLLDGVTWSGFWAFF